MSPRATRRDSIAPVSVLVVASLMLPVAQPVPLVGAHRAQAVAQEKVDASAHDARLRSASVPSRHIIDQLVFQTPLSRFRLERSRAKRTHRWLITRTDGCTAPLVGSSGRSFDFRLACERHDLAYANYALLDSPGRIPRESTSASTRHWTPELRAAVDDQFQRDMQSLCSKRVRSQRIRCDLWVVVFFHAVRISAGP